MCLLSISPTVLLLLLLLLLLTPERSPLLVREAWRLILVSSEREKLMKDTLNTEGSGNVNNN